MTHSGLGRIGAGVASSATSSTIIMSSTWASVVPAGTVPKDYPRHFDGLSGRPRASVSRRSPRSRAHRGHRAGFVEVGSGGDQGQHIEVSAGHAHQLQGLGLGRTLQKIVGVIVGAASRTGREHLQGSSPPDSTLSRIRGDLDVRDPRRSPRARASVRRWPWSSRRGRSVQVKLIKMGGRLVRHSRRLIFQLSEVLDRIGRLSPAPS